MHLERTGYTNIEDVIDDYRIAALIDHFQTAATASSSVEHNGSTFAMRNLLADHLMIRQLADSSAVRSLVDPVLGSEAFAVRGIFFDKTPCANWKVPWHQDLSIAVVERVDVPGFGPWSVKAGVPHVQPPVQILENMLTVRLHLDDCGIDNGPLLVLPGSHGHGVLSADRVDQLRETCEPVACTVGRGGVLLMRPLLLHASRSANSPAHRRVIHIEYARDVLPTPLKWFIA